MRFSPLVDRIAFRGAATWSVHMEAARMRDAGQDVIFLTVGDPDQAPPEPVIEATIDALRRRRTGYSAIIGYPRVRQAIAARFQRRTGRPAAPTMSSSRPAPRAASIARCNAWPARATRSSCPSRSTTPTGGDRRERRAHGDRAVARRDGGFIPTSTRSPPP